jgi:hypothetical protein
MALVEYLVSLHCHVSVFILPGQLALSTSLPDFILFAAAY